MLISGDPALPCSQKERLALPLLRRWGGVLVVKPDGVPPPYIWGGPMYGDGMGWGGGGGRRGRMYVCHLSRRLLTTVACSVGVLCLVLI